jgi:ketosteroid isomerase-like protein
VLCVKEISSMSSKDLVRSLFEDAWNPGAYDEFDRLLSPDHIFDYTGSEKKGLGAFKDFARVYKQAFCQTYEITQLVGDDQFVTAVYIERGTFKNDYVLETGDGVILPTGKPYVTGGIELYRVVGEKIVHTWAAHESLNQYMQAGMAVIRDTRW